MITNFTNINNDGFCEEIVEKELREAGVTIKTYKTMVALGFLSVDTYGRVNSWLFNRQEDYWLCRGPGLCFQKVLALCEKYPNEIKIGYDQENHAPLTYSQGFAANVFIIYTQEALNALAETIRETKTKEEEI